MEISQSIIKLIENEDLRENLTFKGYYMVIEYFSWEKIAKDYINIYKKILKDY